MWCPDRPTHNPLQFTGKAGSQYTRYIQMLAAFDVVHGELDVLISNMIHGYMHVFTSATYMYMYMYRRRWNINT